MYRPGYFVLASMLALIGCGQVDTNDTANAVLPEGPKAQIEAVSATDLPAAVRQAALAKIADLKIAQAERKERDGMTFYDVEGTRADGSEIELDILEKDGALTIVEIQRDIAWADAPAAVRAAADAAPDHLTPERVIESTQNNGTVIYELFAPDKPAEPATEIDWKDGRAALRKERNAY